MKVNLNNLIIHMMWPQYFFFFMSYTLLPFAFTYSNIYRSPKSSLLAHMLSLHKSFHFHFCKKWCVVFQCLVKPCISWVVFFFVLESKDNYIWIHIIPLHSLIYNKYLINIYQINSCKNVPHFFLSCIWL